MKKSTLRAEAEPGETEALRVAEEIVRGTGEGPAYDDSDAAKARALVQAAQRTGGVKVRDAACAELKELASRLDPLSHERTAVTSVAQVLELVGKYEQANTKAG